MKTKSFFIVLIILAIGAGCYRLWVDKYSTSQTYTNTTYNFSFSYPKTLKSFEYPYEQTDQLYSLSIKTASDYNASGNYESTLLRVYKSGDIKADPDYGSDGSEVKFGDYTWYRSTIITGGGGTARYHNVSYLLEHNNNVFAWEPGSPDSPSDYELQSILATFKFFR